jgi:hypothetical protein
MDWGRVCAALKQKAKRHNISDDILRQRNQDLVSILSICGEMSQGRKVATRIGEYLLLQDTFRILVPCCPDYAHSNGRYTFSGLSGGISLLAEKHIAFVFHLKELIPKLEIVFMYADLEAEDTELCKVTGTTKTQFLELLESSILVTRAAVEGLGIKVEKMSTVIPDLSSREGEYRAMLEGDTSYRQRIETESIARSTMYYRIRQNMTAQEMRARTIRTAAQYLALGQFASSNNYLICNHTTVNLSWYLQVNAPVLHNPVDVY